MVSSNGNGSRLLVRVFDGTRQPLQLGKRILVRVLDGEQQQVRCDFFQKPNILYEDLPFYDNYRDNHTLIVSADDFMQAGLTPLPLQAGRLQVADVMLLPKNNTYNFSLARWEEMGGNDPALFEFLSNGAESATDAKARYYELMERKSSSLACLFNTVTAMREIHLPQGNPLDYFKRLI